MPTAADVIAIAADHAGFALKEVLKEDLLAAGHQVLDLGTSDGTTSVDYPDFGVAVSRAIASGEATRGVLVCGTGIGISIAANREPKVRCALCHDTTTARLAREHNDANVIALGARVVGQEVARDALKVFLATEFAGGRHARRVDKLSGADAKPNLKAIA
jgi:ribose 5-phosphate isomerase B